MSTPLIVDVTTAHLADRLISSLDESVREAVDGKRVAIAFSGGLDSGIVATLCKRYAAVTLYTVGIRDAYDVKAAEGMAKVLGLPWRHLEISEENLEKELPEMIRITGTVNPITLSFEVPLYFVLKHSDETIVLGGQGADELFAGYSKYIGLSKERFEDAVRNDMAQLLDVTLAHERTVASYFGKKVIYPYLDERVVDLVNGIGISGVSEGEVRKPLLRDVARSLGQPELAEKPKKAAQYGSGTMVAMRSMAKKRKMTVREMVLGMAGDIR
ncbi:MAG: asparagine synthase [Methanomassiliicoccaceae archaeon]|jgi:asparagine synthase (glutamine-hydrolysing)|nr:asparagine synthase [Methanomassiliicoccaceae archaeon]